MIDRTQTILYLFEVQRLFVALLLPEPQLSQLALLQAGLPGARWVPPEKFHMTVRFIGEVEDYLVEDIAQALGELEVKDFQVQLEGVGVFDPGNRPRSLWAAVKDHAPLSALHEKCNQALRRLDVMEERRKYLPHVSLARFVDVHHDRLIQYLQGNGDFSAPPFWAGEFYLLRSHLTRHGAVYEIVEEYPLLPN
ncbi:MAG TPA: RNA 2',3'-cyclic phosphodiesterase [Alphaproteobacteria bacterium]|nr:RNA 2',3'-cyclic phosphodiesterase [Alphaproteobacteria bacterium]